MKMIKAGLYALAMVIFGLFIEHYTHFLTGGGASIFYGSIGILYGLIYGCIGMLCGLTYGILPILKALGILEGKNHG